jgi:hypothetical protein
MSKAIINPFNQNYAYYSRYPNIKFYISLVKSIHKETKAAKEDIKQKYSSKNNSFLAEVTFKYITKGKYLP